MNKNAKDITGNRYGMLVAIKPTVEINYEEDHYGDN